MDVERYLNRLGFDREPNVDLATLEALQRTHLSVIPFENLDVFNGNKVRTDLDWSYDKIVERGRGGWCFELNGAFAALLEAIGFRVTRIGAAVLLGGPTEIVDHLTLEVMLDEPYLADVGFGDSFVRPLALNRRGPQDGGSDPFEFIAGAQGTTLTRHDVDGVPTAQYRFKRVTRSLADFEPASQYLQQTKDLSWHKRAFATRLLDGGPDRVTLVGNRLKLQRDGERTETPVTDEEWPEALATWFGLGVPLTSPPSRPDTQETI